MQQGEIAKNLEVLLVDLQRLLVGFDCLVIVAIGSVEEAVNVPTDVGPDTREIRKVDDFAEGKVNCVSMNLTKRDGNTFPSFCVVSIFDVNIEDDTVLAPKFLRTATEPGTHLMSFIRPILIKATASSFFPMQCRVRPFMQSVSPCLGNFFRILSEALIPFLYCLVS